MNKNQNLNSSSNLFSVKNNNITKQNSIGLTPAIVNKYSNRGSTLIALNNIKNYVGKKQEAISFSKEWKYSLYFYNNNISKNLPSDSANLNKLITRYFQLYFNHIVSSDNYRSYKVIRRSLNKIHVARSDIKYTNSKIIFTIYTYNREVLALLRNKKGKKMVKLIKRLGQKINKIIDFDLFLLAHHYKYKLNIGKLVKNIFKNQLSLIQRYKFRLNLNRYKFETKFLIRLAYFIKKFPFYNKHIEFNIVNLKSIAFHTDIFTKLAVLKTKKKYAKIYKTIFYILTIHKIPKVNRIFERSRWKKSVNFDLIENKIFHLNLSSIIAKNLDLKKSFTHIENNLFSIKQLSKIIFDCISYKDIGGIKLSIKGRITRRYRADRAVHRLHWKGGLRNLDSSCKGLSVARKRGFLNPGVEYSIISSKRRIGAFAVKGWSNGK